MKEMEVKMIKICMFCMFLSFPAIAGLAEPAVKESDSIVNLKRALAINPKNAEAMIDLGCAYYEAGSIDLAESTFRNLQENNPPPKAKIIIEHYLRLIQNKRKASNQK